MSAGRGRRAAVLLAFLLGAPAAAAEPAVAPLTVSFRWTEANICTSFSPRIEVVGVPPGTAYLRVKLVDLNVPSYPHGGGTVPYRGSPIIPAGALNGYRGPCPPEGRHDYRLTVEALDTGSLVIGRGEETVPCCP
ncbi:MAG TPA: phospholipid-binding protein [bacterium]|nr:phospholipid-binding protein [bacterium]HPQ66293.1 phospholipid-binding protein [bacterium]